MWDEELERNVVDKECEGCPYLHRNKCSLDAVCSDDIESAFDSPQEAINYFASLKRDELRYSKNACKQPCRYEDDCPCDWDLNICKNFF